MSNTIATSAVICDGVRIGNNVVIEDNVYIDYDVIIRDNVHIKAGTYVGARCILGEYLMDFYADRSNKTHPLTIGKNSLIRSETIIYGDTQIGDEFSTGHRVTIRENSTIGHHVRIGTLSDVQGSCSIGNYVSLHSNVFVAPETTIKDYVWIFPHVVITNDQTPPSDNIMGVTINEFASVAAASVILPGVTIGKDSLVGAGAVVTKDVAEGKVYVGNPAKEKCDTTVITGRIDGKQVYPWRYTFDRGMPWKGCGFDEWNSQKTK